MTNEKRNEEIRALVESGVSQRAVCKRFGLGKSVVGRIVHGTNHKGDFRRPGGKVPSEGYAMTLEDIGAQMGVTRERVRQMESKALRKLMSREHLARVRNRLRDAVAELRRLRREGAPIEAELRAALHVEGLTGAVEFLEAGRAGDLRAILDDADNRGVNDLGSAA